MDVRCPSCNQVLEPTGEMLAGGQSVPIYQCPTCVEDLELFGVKYQGNVTFAVLPSGEVVRTSQMCQDGE